MNGFREAMAALGVVTDAPLDPDGALHRFHVEGDSPGSKNGWYVLFGLPVPAGAFGCWKRGVSSTWCARQNLSRDERYFLHQQMQSAKAAQDAARRKDHESAYEAAWKLWHGARVADPQHPYLTAKRVQPHGIRQAGKVLLVPVAGYDGGLSNVQRIYPNGRKFFLPGGAIRERFFRIGAASERVWICEGFATGASLHEATGECVAVAFNCGNLGPVARAIRRRNQSATIAIMADDDRWTAGNPGLNAGREAARKVQGELHVPDFTGLPLDSRPTDFNDLRRILHEQRHGKPRQCTNRYAKLCAQREERPTATVVAHQGGSASQLRPQHSGDPVQG